MKVYFSDWFDVEPSLLEKHGAFNVSLINDLPLFIDPFLLFASTKPEYQALHDEVIRYLAYLRDFANDGELSTDQLKHWFRFPEVRQLWLGFSVSGNGGTGLGLDFAKALRRNMGRLFSDSTREPVTKAKHLEKLCLFREGVGRDHVSDFTANLIKKFLLDYTSAFAKAHIAKKHRATVAVDRVYFDYDKGLWIPKNYNLPYAKGDYVLLTPKDILTKDDNWINRSDMFHDLKKVIAALPDAELRTRVNHYVQQQLAKVPKSGKGKDKVLDALIQKYPIVVDYFIRRKENTKSQAVQQSADRVEESDTRFVEQLHQLITRLENDTNFYETPATTFEECMTRLRFLKEEIEDNDGWRLFYVKGEPVERELDFRVLFRLLWRDTVSDFNSEVNNGRGPVDFKVSRGRKDKTIVEFKLASNRKLEQGIAKQVPIYEKANRTKSSIIAIFFFTSQQHNTVKRILRRLKREKDRGIVLINCRKDNKASASKASDSDE
ncbi:MAG: hypothetical protein IPK87_00960 [Planctomycetes bacterium]|nr:hypothetical protein [Planctomycetota bacterium]